MKPLKYAITSSSSSERHGHAVVPSSPLVPGNDPTLLFHNAGMVQFKEVFLGAREASVRAGREQPALGSCAPAASTTDLENVGYTARHHTFFEMAGQLSVSATTSSATRSVSAWNS